ncbi:MAG TPA: hypothetical protein VGO33_15510 [Gemmatimonadaceae bacterium]|jgi:hypothetical protein|nr:hypothetical protein [Gemmatimonadaceae bacterium]
MPTNKDLKRLVRARMKKTGEAYTAARSHIVTKPRAATKSVDYAALAGMSDETIKAKTGCTWERWVHALDRKGAEKMTHRDIVAVVNEKYKIDGWWSQTVTVGYERIKGLRARGQRRDGTYEAGKSRTFNVPVTALFDAWADPSVRRRWLIAESVKVRTATAPKSIRLGWSDGSIIAVGFMPKGKSRSSVALSHTKLPDRETATRLKEFWSERLDALGEVLSKR